MVLINLSEMDDNLIWIAGADRLLATMVITIEAVGFG